MLPSRPIPYLDDHETEEADDSVADDEKDCDGAADKKAFGKIELHGSPPSL